MVFGRGIALALLLLSAAVIGLIIASAATTHKTLGPPSQQTNRSLPSTGGWPEESLSLTGRLAYDEGAYRLKVDALPGYLVVLRFATHDLEGFAAAHVGQRITVSGYWDSSNPEIFVVESAAVRR